MCCYVVYFDQMCCHGKFSWRKVYRCIGLKTTIEISTLWKDGLKMLTSNSLTGNPGENDTKIAASKHLIYR